MLSEESMAFETEPLPIPRHLIRCAGAAGLRSRAGGGLVLRGHPRGILDHDLCAAHPNDGVHKGQHDQQATNDGHHGVQRRKGVEEHEDVQRRAQSAAQIVHGVGHMPAGAFPSLREFGGHAEISEQLDAGDKGAEEQHVVADFGGAEVEDDGDQGIEVFKHQDLPEHAVLVFVRETLGQPAVERGLGDHVGGARHGAVHGGEQRKHGPEDDEQDEERRGEDALGHNGQRAAGGVGHGQHAGGHDGNAAVNDQQHRRGHQHRPGDIAGGVLGRAAVVHGQIVAGGGVVKQHGGAHKALEAAGEEIPRMEVKDRVLQMEQAKNDEQHQRRQQAPGHELLHLGHDVDAKQVDNEEQRQEGDGGDLGGDKGQQVVHIPADGGGEQGAGKAAGEAGDGLEACGDRPQDAGDHGVLAAAQPHGAGDEHDGKNIDQAQHDGGKVRQPRGVAGVGDGGPHQRHHAGANDLPHRQRQQFRPAQGSFGRFGDGFHLKIFSEKSHGDPPLISKWRSRRRWKTRSPTTRCPGPADRALRSTRSPAGSRSAPASCCPPEGTARGARGW